MASRYHWETRSFHVSTVIGDSVLPDLTVLVPNGATMKRFLTKDVIFTGTTSGDNVQMVQPLYTFYQVQILDGDYGLRTIYSTIRAFPMSAVCLFDVTEVPPHNRVYSQFVCAGDKELAFNERSSYGTHDGPGFNVQLKTRIWQQGNAAPAHLAGDYQLQFAVLYYL